MKAKEYLEQIEKIDKMITNKVAESDQWYAIATSISAPMDGNERVQASGSQHKMADAVDRYIDLQREIDETIDSLVNKKKEVIKTIEQLPVAEYDLLHKVYIQGKDLKEASAESKNTYSWATTVHGRALKHLQNILDDRGIG